MKEKAELRNKPKKPVSTVNKNLQEQQDGKEDEKKYNVRTTDYKKMEEIFLTDPDSVTREEFLLFQRAVGYRRALQLLNEGKRRKQLMKLNGTGKKVRNIQQNKEHDETNANQKSVIQKQKLSQVRQIGENEPIQRKSAKNASSSTGLPSNLRSGLENLSGIDLSDVSVHKNSDKPQQVGALAYTQGNNIHIAPGQEKYLPHEGWHAVQQKQGRVPPTMQMKSGTLVNDNAELEKEADVMGDKAVNEGSKSSIIKLNKPSYLGSLFNKVIQRVQEDKITLYAPNTGAKIEIKATDTNAINYLKSQGYSQNPPNKGKKVENNTDKIILYAPNTGSKSEVKASDTKTIEYLKKQGYTEIPPQKKKILYAPNTGTKTEVKASDTKTIEYLKKQGYSDTPPKKAKEGMVNGVNYKELNSDYWNRTDGYFDGFWWQDESKLREAAEVMRLEIRKTGPYKLNTNLGYKMTDDPNEINKRMFAIQALSNALRTGYYDEGTLSALEIHMMLYGMDFSDHTLDEKKLDFIIERYEKIKFKELGNKLEGGWGDVIGGLMVLGLGYVSSRNLSSANTKNFSSKSSGSVNTKNVSSKSSSSVNAQKTTNITSKTIISPEMENKILYGERSNGNKLIGGHSPQINNANPNYAVEVISENADGTKVVKFTTQYSNGNLAKIKTSTLFPENWSNKNIIDSIKTVGDTPPIGVRDNLTLHRGIVNGVEIDVIKDGNNVISGYPTGGKLTPGFNPVK
ncbi:EndoU domain-containing protein [Ruminiclostridium herbifermentans]|nr:EndoU domain-containing protein [Ruminiclostridium herbifermentans]